MTTWNANEPWWPKGRKGERYRVTLLNQKEATIQTTLDGVSGGVIDWNVDNEIRAGGNLDLEITEKNKNIDWTKVRIRIDHILKYQGVDKVYPLGIYIPSAPKVDMSAVGSTVDIEFYDKSIILKQDCLRSSKAFAKNSKMTDAVRWIIESTGEKNIAIDSSTKRFSSNRVYPAGTSKLEMLRKILADLNFFAVWCNGVGQFQCRAYKLPSRRPIVYSFKAGSSAIHEPQWELDQDGFEVPNRVVCIQRAPSKGAAKVGYAEDLTSKWGFKSRGRWVTRVELDVDEKTTAKLTAKAKTLLKSSQDIHDKVTLKHAFLPLEMNQLVYLDSQGYKGNFAVREMRVTLTPTVLVESRLEGVTR